ncbi:MAG: VOC family protein [Gammaproteobacteria bacterium]
MPRLRLDHIVITAPMLDVGVHYIKELLGTEPQAGGEHPRMGTHNRLLRLGGAQYLEVIAPNPQAPIPARPRWFGLDRLHSDAEPTLSAWVLCCSDIEAAVASCSESLGDIEAMNRSSLNWLITIPADGNIPLDGVGPALIEWHTDVHPAVNLENRCLNLARLEIRHPEPERAIRMLASLGVDEQVSVVPINRGDTPSLTAHIETPDGMRIIDGRK